MGVGEIGEYAEKLIGIEARKLVGRAGITRSEIEDLRQDLRLHLWRRLPMFDPRRAKYETFVDRIVRHRAATIVEFRKAARRSHLRCQCSLNEGITAQDGETIERASMVDEEAGRRRLGAANRSSQETDLALDVAAFISSLPADLRDLCLRLRSRSPTEVAIELGIPRGSLYRTLRELRRRLEEAGLEKYL